MPRLGFGELLVIGFVLLVVFSASRMAALGNSLGKFVHSFRKASRGEGFIDVKPGRSLPGRPRNDKADGQSKS
jgi:sec-independent protein translocase protein TatA